MKNKNVIQKIGFVLFVIGIVGKYLGKALGGEVNETLAYAPLVSFLGLVIWVIGYIISERQKKNEINTDFNK